MVVVFRWYCTTFYVFILQFLYFVCEQESRIDKGKKAESSLSKVQQDPDYASDAELLAAAGN